MRKQQAYLIDVNGTLLDSGCLSDGYWALVKVLSLDENSGLATIESVNKKRNLIKAPKLKLLESVVSDGDQTEIISIDRLRPIDQKNTGIPYYAEIFTTKNGVMSQPVSKSKSWQDIMSLQRRVLRLAAFGKHTIIQVPAIKPITEPDQSFPGVCFQENGSVIIDNTPAFHVEQSHKPAQSHQGPLIPEEYYLKLFSKWDGCSLESMVVSMKLAADLYQDVFQTSDQTNWEKAASLWLETRFNPETYGQSGKLDAVREAAKKEGALTVEMSWDVNCDMDMHCYFLNESGKLHFIYWEYPRYCVKCDVLFSGGGCKCGKEYEIYLCLDHTSGPATELITVGRDVKGHGIFGAHVYDVEGVSRNDKFKVSGCIRASNGGVSHSPSLTFQGSQNKSTKQLVFDGSVDNPNDHGFSDKSFDQHARKTLLDGGGILFPDPLDKPFGKVDVSNEEREERNELLKTSGYENVTISPSTPPVNTLVWQAGVGAMSEKCPRNLAQLKELPISINNPAVQPAMFGQVNLPDDKKSSQIFVLVSPGETVSGSDTRPMPEGGTINATRSGSTFEEQIFSHLFQNYPMLQVDKIFLVKNCFFCTFVVYKEASEEQKSNLSMFMGQELKVSPKVDSKIVADKKLRHAFGSHKFPVVNEKELLTIGISIQPGWKIPIGQPDSKKFIPGPPKLNVQTPWYKTATAADGFNEAIADAPARVPIMEKMAKICTDQKVVAFFSTFSDPTYPEKTDGMARVLLNCQKQLAALEVPKNKNEMKSYCQKIWNDGKDPNMSLWDADPEVKELIESASRMPATEGRKQVFTTRMINTALKPMEIREREKRKQEQVDRDLKEKKSKHQEELIRQEERIKARIQSTLALQLEQPRSAQGGQICAVCMTQTVEMTFNCGHASTCMTCSDNLDTCPICRANITSRNRLYLAGLEPEKMET